MRRALAAVVVVAVGAIAHADPPPAPNQLEVVVGKTVEREVGVVRGYFCNDPSLITATLVTRGNSNFWIVTGLKAGKTQCRVGDFLHPALLFDVTVKEP
ncbi:MAG TPA: hypothetical protein VGL61_23145 [Kofleriaceae bacterium]|jgi:hypothetical protein